MLAYTVCCQYVVQNTVCCHKNIGSFEFECDFGSKIELNLSLCIIHYPKKKAVEFEVFNSY